MGRSKRVVARRVFRRRSGFRVGTSPAGQEAAAGVVAGALPHDPAPGGSLCPARADSLAEETLEAHLLHFPTDQDALYRLLVLLEQQGCFEQASILYERNRRTLEAHGKQPAQHVRVLYERFQQAVSSCDEEFPGRTGIVSPSTARGEPSQRSLASVVTPDLSRGGSEDAEINRISTIGRVSSLPGNDGLSDSTLDLLRRLLEPEREGMQDVSLLSRRQLLELGIAAFLSRLAQLDGKRISAIEREALGRALGESVAAGWKLYTGIRKRRANGKKWMPTIKAVTGAIKRSN